MKYVVIYADDRSVKGLYRGPDVLVDKNIAALAAGTQYYESPSAVPDFAMAPPYAAVAAQIKTKA